MKHSRIIHAFLLSSLLLSSCAEMGNMLNDTGLMTGGGAALGGIVGYATGDTRSERQRNAAIGAGLGALGGFALSKVYTASLEQQRQANARANAALSSRSVMRSVSAKGTRYVAVPVKSQRKGGGTDLMKYDVKNRQLASTKVYTPESQKKNTDGTVSLGWDDAYLYNP